MAVPLITLNNGLKMPQLGLGTNKSPPGVVEQAIMDAIDAGYRHIDCAHVYDNEKEVGVGIRAKIAEGVVKREDMFITSKLWNTHHRPGAVLPALKRTLSDLGLDYLDLYLIHFPIAFKEGPVTYDLVNGKAVCADIDYLDTWKAMEELVEAGLVRSIGVSNFNSEQVKRVVTAAKIKPVTNQVEFNPYFNQYKLRELCEQLGVVITAHRPLGSPANTSLPPGTPNLLHDPVVVQLGAKYGKTGAQIVLKYLLQTGVVAIPKSVTKSRIQENIDIFDFELSVDEMKRVDSVNRGVRLCLFEVAAHCPHYPFNIEF